MRYKTLCRVLVKLLGLSLIAYALPEGVQYCMAWILLHRQGAVSGQMWYPMLPYGDMMKVAIGLYLLLYGKSIVNLIIPSNRPYCGECGYELTRVSGKHCPECGTPLTNEDLLPYDQRYPKAQPLPDNSLDTLSQAMKLEKRGDTAEAIELYARIAGQWPQSPDGDYAAARARELRNKVQAV